MLSYRDDVFQKVCRYDEHNVKSYDQEETQKLQNRNKNMDMQQFTIIIL